MAVQEYVIELDRTDCRNHFIMPTDMYEDFFFPNLSINQQAAIDNNISSIRFLAIDIDLTPPQLYRFRYLRHKQHFLKEQWPEFVRDRNLRAGSFVMFGWDTSRRLTLKVLDLGYAPRGSLLSAIRVLDGVVDIRRARRSRFDNVVPRVVEGVLVPRPLVNAAQVTQNLAPKMSGGKRETVKRAEEMVEKMMKDNDASHNASHVFRVRDMALSLAADEGLSSSPQSMFIVELAALLHDIGDYKYARDPSEERLIEQFLEEEGIEEDTKMKIVGIIKAMGFKEELSGVTDHSYSLEFGVVQDADRLDAIGAIGIARCFTFGGSRNRILHDPNIKPRFSMSKEDYMDKEKQTTLNHFHEKLLKLKNLMKTQAGRRRAERRHAFMEEFVEQFYLECDGKA